MRRRPRPPLKPARMPSSQNRSIRKSCFPSSTKKSPKPLTSTKDKAPALSRPFFLVSTTKASVSKPERVQENLVPIGLIFRVKKRAAIDQKSILGTEDTDRNGIGQRDGYFLYCPLAKMIVKTRPSAPATLAATTAVFTLLLLS
jgi:hypothetical protein